MKKITVALFVLMLAVSCKGSKSVETDDVRFFCPDEYDPVCGVDGRTYSNQCFIDNAGIDILYHGRCKNASELGQACTREYRPVCGVDGKTYPNACSAGDVGIDYQRECGQEGRVEMLPSPCTMEYAPVCGVDNKTYGNRCELENSNVAALHDGECK